MPSVRKSLCHWTLWQCEYVVKMFWQRFWIDILVWWNPESFTLLAQDSTYLCESALPAFCVYVCRILFRILQTICICISTAGIPFSRYFYVSFYDRYIFNLLPFFSHRLYSFSTSSLVFSFKGLLLRDLFCSVMGKRDVLNIINVN